MEETVIIMKISIIIPSYNTDKYIRQAINSVLFQEGDVECIVIDGGSTDGTLDILKSYGEKITWISEPDNGEASAINKGLAMATGDVVGWLDADDVYLPGALEVVASCFQLGDTFIDVNQTKVSNIKWLYGKCKIIDADGREKSKIITRFKEFWQKRYTYNRLLVVNFIAQPSTFWRRELLGELGFIDEHENLVMDYEYWLRIGAKYKPMFINRYLACWRSHGESQTSMALVQDMKDDKRVSRHYSSGRWVINTLKYLTCYFVIAAYFIMGRR